MCYVDSHCFWKLKDNEQLVLLKVIGYHCYNNTPVVVFEVGGLQVHVQACFKPFWPVF